MGKNESGVEEGDGGRGRQEEEGQGGVRGEVVPAQASILLAGIQEKGNGGNRYSPCSAGGPTSQLKIDTTSNNRPWTKEEVNTVCPEPHLPPIPEHYLVLPRGHACAATAFRLHAHRCNTATAIKSPATVQTLCNPRCLQSTAKNKI